MTRSGGRRLPAPKLSTDPAHEEARKEMQQALCFVVDGQVITKTEKEKECGVK